MKLLRKTIAIILLSFLLLLGASLSFYRFSVMGDFLKIENDIVERDAVRVNEAIEAERHLMRVTAIDWAQWDDMYDYMKSPNRKFEESWSTYESYKALRITDTLFLNLQKKVVFAVHVNFEEEAVETSKKESPLIKDLLVLPQIFDFSGETPSQAVFGTLNGQPVLVAASPILDSNRSKPSRGYMLIVKQIDADFITKIAEQTRLSLTVLTPLSEPANSHLIKQLALRPSGRPLVKTVSDESIQAFLTLADAAGDPLMLLKVDESRPVYNQGLANLRLFVGFWVMASITAILLAIVLLNKFIITRLQRVCSFLNGVRVRKIFSERLPQAGNDELAQLSSDINQMLAALSEAHADVESARQAAEEANLAKSTFIARVSHELRNPIHGIRGINNLILKRESSKAVRELIQMGDVAAESLLSIVDEILDFSKAEAGELTFERIPYDLRQVVRDTMQGAAARLDGKYRSEETGRVQLICEVDPNVPHLLEGDPTRLKQILINLLTNAVKFTERGYVGLKIAAEDCSESSINLRIEVWDTGIGIPEAKLGTLFTPFKQADETIARRFQGTGLGLSIVKEFVEGLGGSVAVRSIAGEGSTFGVKIPQRIAGAAAVETQPAKAVMRPPAVTVMLAAKSLLSTTLANSLTALGTAVAEIDPFSGMEVRAVADRCKAAGLVVVAEEVVADPRFFGIIKASLNESRCCLVAVLRPSSLELREKLYALGMRYVLTAPVLADDILSAYAGNLPLLNSVSDELNGAIESVRKLRVIIADDAPTNRIILQEMLEDSGHQVVPVSDGKEIINLLTPMLTGEPSADQFDLVITDVSMSIMNGDEAARLIRELESKNSGGMHLPIIAITGQALEGEQEQMRSAGIDGILTKPMHPRQLAELLGRLFPGN